MQNRADEAIVPLERAARRSDDPVTETLLAAALATSGAATTRKTGRAGPLRGDRRFRRHFSNKSDASTRPSPCWEVGLRSPPMRSICERSLGIAHGRNNRAEARAVFSQLLAAAPERYDVLVGLAKVMALDDSRPFKAPVCVASNTRPAVERVRGGTSYFACKSIGGEEPKCP
jgi:hypothetical protein